MKKFFAFLLTAAMLVSMFAVVSLAAEVELELYGVDVPVEADKNVLCTSLEQWANCNPNWANNLQLTKDGDNWKVVAASSCPIEAVNNGDATDVTAASGFTANEGDIFLILHYAETNTDAYSVGVGMTVEIPANPAAGDVITFSGEMESSGSSASGDSYDTTNNVALGKDYTGEGYKMSSGDWPASYQADLTDGKALAQIDYSDSWFALCRSAGDSGVANVDENGVGTIVVDLGAATDITGVKVNTFVGDEAGIKAPAKITASIAATADGEYTVLGDLDMSNVNDNNVAWAELEATANGQFVKIDVTLDASVNFAFINEIVVLGAEAEGDTDADTDTDTDTDTDSDTDAPVADFEMGEENEDAVFVADIIAPETYVAGEDVVVTISINDITLDSGLHTIKVPLYFDNNKLEIKGIVEGNFAVPAMVEYAEWEDMTKYVVLEDGTIMLEVAAATPGTSMGEFTPAKADGEITFNVTFVAKADATGDIALWAPHAGVTAQYISDTAVTDYVGNGDSAVIAEEANDPEDDAPSTEDETTEDENPTDSKPGDATSMIFFAIIALVAIVGSAVVIKTRR